MPIFPAHERSDAELLDDCRAGDTAAFGVLWERHRRAGYVAARNLAPSLSADDLVAEAYLRILELVTDGRGPHGAFRPYLYRVIRSIAADTYRSPEDSSDELDAIPDLTDAVPWEERSFDRDAAARAFGTLNERWQAVLWYTEVEGMPPREVAKLLGISPNSVSALAVRAREGLQSAWVEAHVDRELADAACRTTLGHLQRYQRGKLTAAASRDVAAHLDACDSCAAAAREYTVLNRQLALVLAGILLGIGPASALLAGLGPSTAASAATGATAGIASPGSGAGAGSGGAAGGNAAGAAGAGAAGAGTGLASAPGLVIVGALAAAAIAIGATAFGLSRSDAPPAVDAVSAPADAIRSSDGAEHPGTATPVSRDASAAASAAADADGGTHGGTAPGRTDAPDSGADGSDAGGGIGSATRASADAGGTSGASGATAGSSADASAGSGTGGSATAGSDAGSSARGAADAAASAAGTATAAAGASASASARADATSAARASADAQGGSSDATSDAGASGAAASSSTADSAAEGNGDGSDPSLSAGFLCFEAGSDAGAVHLRGSANEAGAVTARVTLPDGSRAIYEDTPGVGMLTQQDGAWWSSDSITPFSRWSALPNVPLDDVVLELRLTAADGRYSPWIPVDTSSTAGPLPGGC
ncbi:sigma-70 family RNA polymerase sigma factor [Leucobacter allii]|uniref:RNA polymerase sigma factor n=1 Tax=Leucobacter allii TaxID=2932247 RepID=UPI001FD20513|nr:sigma-70 family RNA polymerase sigma factor [Leucobacter allii]UOR02115.1 sigma-70 family RNA polymerase sigma factor [Leucobacter allii]